MTGERLSLKDDLSLSVEYKEKEEMLVVIYKKQLKLLELERLERENTEKDMKRLKNDKWNHQNQRHMEKNSLN